MPLPSRNQRPSHADHPGGGRLLIAAALLSGAAFVPVAHADNTVPNRNNGVVLIAQQSAAGLIAKKPAARPETPSLSTQAEAIAKSLAAACPVVPYNDEKAFEACTNALKTLSLPLESDIAWGGDQPDKPIKKRNLTHFGSQLFKTMYLPLYTFTGRWSLDEDKRSHAPIIRLEAYFRNTLPAGDYPYPFWHSADKWNAYETSNEVRMYFNPQGTVFAVTRDAAGSDDKRGTYSHAVTPAFNGAWQWQDAGGTPEPRVTLFSARYSAANPNLASVDGSYRTFALRMRDSSCLECHTPLNKAGSERLVLLQTPRHAAAEIDNVIKALQTGEMPQDDLGLRKDIPHEERASVLAAAEAFRKNLTQADKWEGAHTK